MRNHGLRKKECEERRNRNEGMSRKEWESRYEKEGM